MKKIIGQILILLLILLSFGCNKENYKYKVTLDFDGGDFKTNVIYFNDGKDVRLPKPKKDNCTFIGWYEFDYVGEGNLVEKIENRNYNLTAKYTHNKEYSEYEGFENEISHTTYYVYENNEYTCYHSFEISGVKIPSSITTDNEAIMTTSIIMETPFIKCFYRTTNRGFYSVSYDKRDFKGNIPTKIDISWVMENDKDTEIYGITKEFITLDLEEVPKEDCNDLDDTVFSEFWIYTLRDSYYNRVYIDFMLDPYSKEKYHFDLQMFGIDGNNNIFDLLGYYNMSQRSIISLMNGEWPMLDNIELEYIVIKCIYTDDETGITKTLYYKASFASLRERLP